VSNIGTPEILVVLIVALLVLGPQRLPQAARQFGKAMAEFRRVTGGLQAEMRDAMSTIENEIKSATDTTGPQATPPPAKPAIFEPPTVGPAPITMPSSEVPVVPPLVPAEDDEPSES
jgi:Tat protein translocase TatB subunit